MTFDGSLGSAQLHRAMRFRAIVIVVGGLLTTQPIELLLFRDPIQRRIREESVRREMIIEVNDYRNLSTGRVLGLSEEENKVTNLEAQRQKVSMDAAIAEGAAKSAKLAEANALQSYKQATTGGDPALIAEKERLYRTAQGKAARAAEKSTTMSTYRDGMTVDVAAANSDLQSMMNNKVQAPLDRMKACLKEIRRLPDYGAKTLKCNNTEFKDPPYDFVQRLRVLGDLALNQPPVWPDANKDEKDFCEKEFGLYYEKKDHIHESWLYRVWWLLVFLFSFIMPMMSFLYKILLPRELADYYSSSFQRAFGHPEARAYEEARKRVELEKRADQDTE